MGEKDLILGGPQDGRSIGSCRKLRNPLKPDKKQFKVQVQKGQKLTALVLSKIILLGGIKENVIKPGLGC